MEPQTKSQVGVEKQRRLRKWKMNYNYGTLHPKRAPPDQNWDLQNFY